MIQVIDGYYSNGIIIKNIIDFKYEFDGFVFKLN